MKKILISFLIASSVTGFAVWKLQAKPLTLGANQKISELSTLSSPSGTDVLPIVNSGSTKQISVSNLLSFITATYPVQYVSNVISLAFGTTTNNLWSGTNIWQNASSTIVGNLTIGGNATATNATTTNFFATTASSTNFFGANLPGAGCNGVQFLQWTAGRFGCGSTSGGITSFSTTTLQNMATTTIRSNELPSGNRLRLTLYTPAIVGSASTTNTSGIYVSFNTVTDPSPGTLYFGHRVLAVTNASIANPVAQLMIGPTGGFLGTARAMIQRAITMEISNASTASHKHVSFDGTMYATTTAGVDSSVLGEFTWATTTTAITSIDIYTGGPVDQAAFATSTVIQIEGY